MTDPVVSTAWLAEHLHDPDVKVVDASWYMTPQDGDGRADYDRGHIPGAVFFGIDEIADRRVNLPHMLPPPAMFARVAAEMGLDREQTVVVYDGNGVVSAPRVWWTLRAMGFSKVRVLDGGLKKWRAEGGPVEIAAPAPKPTTAETACDADLVANAAAVRARLDDHAAQLVDARPAARFRGEAPEPRPGLRGGHMPGALNLPASEVLNPDRTLKSAVELRAAFEAAGVDLDRPIITTCGSGVTASTLALALARLGRTDVAVYDGSWSEWGALADAPVITG